MVSAAPPPGEEARPPGSARGDEFSDLGLRADIDLSWRRSRQALAPVDKLDVPFGEIDDDAHRLMRAVGPVLARFSEHLADTRYSLVLADRTGRVVSTFSGADDVRRHLASLSIDQGFVLSEGAAGTNGIGTVLEVGRPLMVIAEEHYSEPLKHLICAGTPLRNPVTGRLEGVLDLACPREEWSTLIAPALEQLRHDVEGELAATAPLAHRLIFERFAARCRETSAAVIGVSDQYMITNAAAADLLSPADQAVIWSALGDDEGGGARSITLADGRTVEVTSQLVRAGRTVGGHLVELAPHSPVRRSRPRRRPPVTTVASLVDSAVRADPERLLILGERGSGKATVAGEIHRRLRGDRPIAVLPCELALVADGRSWLDERATRLQRPDETIVLRHVDELPAPVARAVGALLDRAATNSGPRVLGTASGPFAEGRGGALRDALGPEAVQLPPLRDRRAEIAGLAARMLTELAPAVHLSGRALAALRNYDWPGNLPQLRSVLAQAAHASGRQVIGLEHLPGEVAGSLRGPRALSRIEELEREAIIAALREQHGNKLRAAETLGMSRSTFYRRLRQLGLDSSTLLS